ncbi:hypothetical protein OG568_52600 (plasmid) [Streptomyces sp. NBC_01450]|uniref:hypothetical protein n=1 Tax=Streptomyces sp. NBC_01450 TaxID=2903871 RepID=UPI002E33C5CA|nr:hypothetical protein [Streptomyces sp. NBC_01450]
MAFRASAPSVDSPLEVLVDRNAVTSGAAASGEPWQYFDLGHDWCTYCFFEQRQRRMAYAWCDFYTPKDSSEGHPFEAKENLQRMLASIPLTDDKRTAVVDGQAAVDALLERLVDVPTPAGPTPRDLRLAASAHHVAHRGGSVRAKGVDVDKSLSMLLMIFA